MTTNGQEAEMVTTMQPSGNGLTAGEVRHFGALEKRIERGLGVFREVGEALLEIRDKRLYRQNYSSFEQYCADRWGLQRTRAYQLIGAAEVMEALGDESGAITNEAQARELLPLLHADPGSLAKVVSEAEKEGPLTAPAIRRAVQAASVASGHVPDPVVARTVGADRLVGRINTTFELVEAWLKAEPSPEDKRKVVDALNEVIDLLK